MTDPRPNPRQPAYDAVYAYLASTTRVPGDLVTRNAIAWRAVHAALDAILGGRTTPDNPATSGDAVDNPALHDGPTVAEAAAADKRHWGEREWGEG